MVASSLSLPPLSLSLPLSPPFITASHDPCRVTVWPPDPSDRVGATAAVTNKSTIHHTLKDLHDKSTTEWILLYEPRMSTIGGYDHHDTKKKNRSSNQKKQRRRQSLVTSPAETMTDAEKETDKEREIFEKSEGSLPGNVYFNPFTCEYIVLLPSRHGTNDVPTMSWRQECRVIVSVGRYSKVDDEKMIGGGQEEKDGRVEEEDDDDEMEESRDHVSNSVRGLFSKCATCGTSTSQQYEDQLEKWKTKMGFGDAATVIDEDVLNELKKRKGRWLSHAKKDSGDQHEKINAAGRPFRESWMPTSIDHVDGHLFATSSSSSTTTTVTMGMGGGLSSQIFARNNTSIQQRTLLQQYYKVALSERSHDLSSSSSSGTKRRGLQGGEEQLSYRDLATKDKVRPNQKHLFKRLEIHEKCVLRQSSHQEQIQRIPPNSCSQRELSDCNTLDHYWEAARSGCRHNILPNRWLFSHLNSTQCHNMHYHHRSRCSHCLWCTLEHTFHQDFHLDLSNILLQQNYQTVDNLNYIHNWQSTYHPNIDLHYLLQYIDQFQSKRNHLMDFHMGLDLNVDLDLDFVHYSYMLMLHQSIVHLYCSDIVLFHFQHIRYHTVHCTHNLKVTFLLEHTHH